MASSAAQRVQGHKIYILREPNFRTIFYVGITVNSLNSRLSGHLHEAVNGNQLKEKNVFIRNLLKEKKSPIIELIDFIPDTDGSNRCMAEDREKHWIKYYQESNCTLLNIANMDCFYNTESQVHYMYPSKQDSEYNPWENERWQKSAGYDPRLGVDFVHLDYSAYKDLDPEYFDQDDVYIH